MESETIIIVSVFSSVSLLLLVLLTVVWMQLCSVKRQLRQTPSVRVQKLRLDSDKNHAFQNPTISPDEELSRRGYSMYVPDSDVESGRGTERQTGGQFVEELARELDSRQQRQAAPPFLLQSIQENKRKSRALANPVANAQGRQSDTNPNFIY